MQVLSIGLHPSQVNFDAHPGFDQQKLTALLDRDMLDLRLNGVAVTECFLFLDGSAQEKIQSFLSVQEFDVIMIGAGIRCDPNMLSLFEQVINLIHVCAAKSLICFNSKPNDTYEAIQRVSPSHLRNR
jgi:hypothetical protein